MGQHLLRGDPSGGLEVQTAQNEVLRLRGHAVQDVWIEKNRMLVDLRQHFLQRLPRVRRLTHEVLVREHTDSPAVDFGAVTPLALGSQLSPHFGVAPQNFRCQVVAAQVEV